MTGAGIDDTEFKAVCDQELPEIERRRRRYLGDRERVDVAGRTAIVVDDGIATGATMEGRLAGNAHAKSKKAGACRARSRNRKHSRDARGGRRRRVS